MIRRLLTVVAAATLLLVGAPAGAIAAGAAPGQAPGGTTGPIVVIGTAGVSWTDVSPAATPALWSLLRAGATGNVTVRSVHTNTCPVDGWLTMSAGERAADDTGPSDTRPPCRAVPDVAAAGSVPRWDAYTRAAAGTKYGAVLGLLGDQVAAHGRCIEAVGPGAAIAAARSNGRVDRYQPLTSGAALGAALRACPATVVDVGAVRDPSDVDPHDAARPTASRAAQVAAVDQRIGAALAAAPPAADVLVVSLADAGRSARLRLVAMRGPHFGAGTLESPSTRQTGLVQLDDVTTTVLEHLGIPVPDSLGGAGLRLVPGSPSEAAARDRLRALVDADLASHKVTDLVPPFFYGWVLLQLALYGVAAVVWRREWGSDAARARLLRVVRRVATVAATVPVATFLANLLPWWRSDMPMLAVLASVGVFALVISAPALLGPWRRALLWPMAFVSAVTVVVLAVDVMTGSRLQQSSLMGLQPVVGGRFYGMGNVTFALFATATLLLCTAVADRLTRDGRPRAAAAAIAAIGLGAVLVDGSPSWGSDFGGPPALLPGVAFLLLTVLGIRITWRRVLLIGGVTVALLAVVAVLDWLRPTESRSHLGRFVQTTIDGGAWAIISRKLAQNMSILFGSVLTLLIPVGLALVIYLLARPTAPGARALQRTCAHVPLLRPGLVSLVITFVIGFVLNDSGTAIPAVGATLALPLVVGVAVRTLEDDTSGTGASRRSDRPASPVR